MYVRRRDLVDWGDGGIEEWEEMWVGRGCDEKLEAESRIARASAIRALVARRASDSVMDKSSGLETIRERRLIEVASAKFLYS